MINLRPYQVELYDAVFNSWQTCRNVLAVSATGSGKTVLTAKIVHDFGGYIAVIAHRAELVNQLSTTLAKAGVVHNIIASQNTIKETVQSHIKNAGGNYYNPSAKVFVASVQTLVKRHLPSVYDKVGLWVIDEAHHVLADNTWGKATKLFKNAKGLGVTATPIRADGKGLGSHVDGVFDQMVEGKPMEWLIQQGFLTTYKIYAPQSDIDLVNVRVSAGGDYNPDDLKKAARQSHIVGDVVKNYLKFAAGKQAIVFATDVQTAEDMAEQFRNAGITAQCLHGGTAEYERSVEMQKFRNRETKVLTNVDLFGEGLDVPGIDCVIMARPTLSFSLYSQMFGRALRPSEGKPHAIIIDHVGNVIRHRGAPDSPREWTLDRREKGGKSGKSDAPTMKTCLNTDCLGVYKAFLRECPYCGHKHQPKARNTPEMVEGDLTELDPQFLAVLRGEIKRIDQPASVIQEKMLFAGAPKIVAASAAKKHTERQEAQARLREAMAIWSSKYRAVGEDDSTIMSRFWYTFNIDMGTAQTLGKPEAEKLLEKINERSQSTSGGS